MLRSEEQSKYEPGWLAETFVNSDDAESSLCADRSSFLRNDQLELVPLHIRRRIIHPGDVAHIEGFRELFDYLNTEPSANDLRQLVVNHFNDRPYLQEHLQEPLSTSSSCPVPRWTHHLGDDDIYNDAGHPGAIAPPFKKSLSGERYLGESPEMV
jgi:hypothetical protein